MFQFMTRAAKAKLRVDRHHCGHTTNPCRPPLPWWIFPQLSSETNASKEACGILLCVLREMIQKHIKEEILLTGLESNHFTSVLPGLGQCSQAHHRVYVLHVVNNE